MERMEVFDDGKDDRKEKERRKRPTERMCGMGFRQE
jgi:hypothetical protein